MRKLAGLAAFAALVGACSSFTPVPIRSGDVCYRCRRVIIDTAVAAETIERTGLVSTFRTSGCLAKYLVEHPDDRSTRFVTDYASGRLVAAETAVFVPTVNRDNGERDYMAFTAGPAADAAAIDRHVTVLDWNGILEAARKQVSAN